MADILSPDQWDSYLSDEVQNRSDLELLVQRAEWRVIDRYRERPRESPLKFDLGDTPGTVQLRGWRETSDGTPDTSAMGDKLLDRLRMTIAQLVTHWDKLEDTQELDSISQGNESVDFKDRPDVPTSVFAPLRPFDERRFRL